MSLKKKKGNQTPNVRVQARAAFGASPVARGWTPRSLARYPTAAHWKDLADVATGWITAQVSGELCVFSCPDKPSQWYFAFHAFLESRVCLDLRGKIRRVVDEILRNGIDLNVVGRDFDADGLHVGKLSASSRTVGRDSLHAAKS